MDDQRKTAFPLFSEVETRAVRIILGMEEGDTPKNMSELARKIWPDLTNSSAPSKDSRVQKLRSTLKRRVVVRSFLRGQSTSWAYYPFYRAQRNGWQCDTAKYSPQDLEFLRAVYEHCPLWYDLREKILNILEWPVQQ